MICRHSSIRTLALRRRSGGFGLSIRARILCRTVPVIFASKQLEDEGRVVPFYFAGVPRWLAVGWLDRFNIFVLVLARLSVLVRMGDWKMQLWWARYCKQDANPPASSYFSLFNSIRFQHHIDFNVGDLSVFRHSPLSLSIKNVQQAFVLSISFRLFGRISTHPFIRPSIKVQDSFQWQVFYSIADSRTSFSFLLFTNLPFFFTLPFLSASSFSLTYTYSSQVK